MAHARPPHPRLGFYRRLSPELRREYDRSDARTTLPLAPSPALAHATAAVIAALAGRSPAATRRAAQTLVDEICEALAAQSRSGRPPRTPKVKVLKTRPRLARSEFHGLYTRFENGDSEIKVWMFTAALKQVVRPRTFLRTLLHEVCHHVDMTWLDLPSSLHTIGFHARESSLLRALERSGARIPGGARRERAARRERDESPGCAEPAAPVPVADDGGTESAHDEEIVAPSEAPAFQLELFSPSARSTSARRRARSD